MKKSVKTFIKENISFLILIIALFSVRSSLADWYDVPSGSMEPGIMVGDRIMVNKVAYTLEFPFTDTVLANTGNIEKGDIVIIDSSAADMRLVKRVVATAGDTIALQNNRLYINGERAEWTPSTNGEDLMVEAVAGHQRIIKVMPVEPQFPSFKRITVPEGHILVMGDNRNNSVDSRYYGFIPISEVQGRAFAVAFSLDKEDNYLPRSDRFFSALL